VLDRLELTDRPAELNPHGGVVGRRPHAPLGDTEGLGPGEQLGQADQGSGIGGAPGAGRQPPPGPDVDPVEPDLRQPAGGVEAGQRLDLEVGAIDHAPCRGVTSGNREHEPVGQRATPDAAGAPRHPPRVVDHQLAGEGQAADHGPVHQRAGQARVAGPAFDRHRRDHRRQQRPRCASAPQLLEHHRQLGDAVALAAVLDAHRQAEPTHVGDLGPPRRQRVGLAVHAGGRAARRLEARPRLGQQAAGLGPAAHGRRQLGVVVGDGQSH
jgi:hypothetical protein